MLGMWDFLGWSLFLILAMESVIAFARDYFYRAVDVAD